jgi:hypothetical protein
MSKQTALQWFLDKLPHSIETQFSKQIEQALQIEQEQIVEAFKIGSDKGYDCALDYITHEECDEHNYYNETYGGNNE